MENYWFSSYLDPFYFFYSPHPLQQRIPEWFRWENSSRSTPPMELKMQLDQPPSDHPFFNFNGILTSLWPSIFNFSGIFPIGMQPVNCHYFASINTDTPQSFPGPSPLETINSSRIIIINSEVLKCDRCTPETPKRDKRSWHSTGWVTFHLPGGNKSGFVTVLLRQK